MKAGAENADIATVIDNHYTPNPRDQMDGPDNPVHTVVAYDKALRHALIIGRFSEVQGESPDQVDNNFVAQFLDKVL